MAIGSAGTRVNIVNERRQVSVARRVVFYTGYFVMAAGFALLLSFLVTGVDAASPSRIRAAALRVLIGLALIPAGLILRKIAIRGLAGSLVILDPPRARADLEPWSRAAGGLLDAALSEVQSAKKIAEAAGGGEKIKVRCLRCKALNDEGDRFCGACGKEL
jgi:hypothetical protein